MVSKASLTVHKNVTGSKLTDTCDKVGGHVFSGSHVVGIIQISITTDLKWHVVTEISLEVIYSCFYIYYCGRVTFVLHILLRFDKFVLSILLYSILFKNLKISKRMPFAELNTA